MPVARIPIISFFAMEIGVDPRAHAVALLLDDLMSRVPVTGGIVPKRAQARVQVIRADAIVKTFDELLISHLVNRLGACLCLHGVSVYINAVEPGRSGAELARKLEDGPEAPNVAM